MERALRPESRSAGRFGVRIRHFHNLSGAHDSFGKIAQRGHIARSAGAGNDLPAERRGADIFRQTHRGRELLAETARTLPRRRYASWRRTGGRGVRLDAAGAFPQDGRCYYNSTADSAFRAAAFGYYASAAAAGFFAPVRRRREGYCRG